MKKNITLKVAAWLTIAGVTSCLLSGCAWHIGSDKGEAVVKPTRGQELTDLKKAKEQGAISEEEYQAQRQRILDK